MMKKISMRIIIAVVFSVIAISLTGTQPVSACTGGSCGGIGGILRANNSVIHK